MSAVRTHAAFENNFTSILDEHAPKKTKILQRNQITKKPLEENNDQITSQKLG